MSRLAKTGNKEVRNVAEPAKAPFAVPSVKPETLILPPRGMALPAGQELLNSGELLFFLIWRDLRVRYRQTAMGVLWILFQPVLTTFIFTLIFGKLARLASDGLPYVVFAFSALVLWHYFSGALGRAANSLVLHNQLITKVYFPRLIIPLAAVLSGLIDFAISFVFLLLLMLFYRIPFGLSILWCPFFLLQAVISALGVGFWLAALNVRYRDANLAIPFLTQLWLYATPVIYSLAALPATWRRLLAVNPLTGAIVGFRWALTGHGRPGSWIFLVSAGMGVLSLIGGLLYFLRVERRFADEI